MQKEETCRTEMLLGSEAMEKLNNAHVAVFGIGGVGGYVCEALARAGVGAIDLFDNDCVSLSNINRQIIALHSTVGEAKVEVMRRRILDINPDCHVTAHQFFYLPDCAHLYPLERYTYIADAIDTVTAKVELAVQAREAGVPLISSMGTGNKLDPTRFAVKDLFATSGCPLARVMRHALRTRGIDSLKVVFSDEPAAPMRGTQSTAETGGKRPPASLPYVPSVAGLIMAGEIIKDIIHAT